MKLIFTLFLLLGPTQSPSALYVCHDLKSMLFSEAPLENIEATSVKGTSVINLNTNEVQFNIPINSYQFSKSLMQEHFNENYMESDKYPVARFKGKINQQIPAGKDGEYPVTVTGDLLVHGVSQQRTLNGIIKVTGNTVAIRSVFTVMCKDHGIKIPSIVFKNIAESIRVTVTGTYELYIPSKS